MCSIPSRKCGTYFDARRGNWEKMILWCPKQPINDLQWSANSYEWCQSNIEMQQQFLLCKWHCDTANQLTLEFRKWADLFRLRHSPDKFQVLCSLNRWNFKESHFLRIWGAKQTPIRNEGVNQFITLNYPLDLKRY